MHLLFTECKEKDAEFFRRAFSSEHVVTRAEPLSPIDDLDDVEVLSVQVHSRLGRTELQRMPRLRLIVTRSVGTDHIDLGAARELGIEVCNVPDYGAQTVAEHTLLLLLAIARRLYDAVNVTRAGRFDLSGLLGRDLSGKTAVVVGVGMIGERFARMALSLGMQVVGVDPVERPEVGIPYVSLDEALPQADALVLCCPLLESTHYLIGGAAFEQLKPGALLVNTARGAIVHAPSLVAALDSGVVAAAGLDVLEHEDVLRGSTSEQPEQQEILHANRALMTHPRVIVTPHIAFYTREALNRLREKTVQIIRNFVTRADATV